MSACGAESTRADTDRGSSPSSTANVVIPFNRRKTSPTRDEQVGLVPNVREYELLARGLQWGSLRIPEVTNCSSCRSAWKDQQQFPGSQPKRAKHASRASPPAAHPPLAPLAHARRIPGRASPRRSNPTRVDARICAPHDGSPPSLRSAIALARAARGRVPAQRGCRHVHHAPRSPSLIVFCARLSVHAQPGYLGPWGTVRVGFRVESRAPKAADIPLHPRPPARAAATWCALERRTQLRGAHSRARPWKEQRQRSSLHPARDRVPVFGCAGTLNRLGPVYLVYRPPRSSSSLGTRRDNQNLFVFRANPPHAARRTYVSICRAGENGYIFWRGSYVRSQTMGLIYNLVH